MLNHLFEYFWLIVTGKTFQKRWCVMKDRIFYYYESKKDKKQNGAFPLEGNIMKSTTYLYPIDSTEDIVLHVPYILYTQW